MYATFTLIPQETPPDTWLCDKTAEEIVAALMAGTTVYAQHTDPLDVTTRLSVNYFTEDEFGAFVLFGGLIEQNEVQFARVGTGQDPEWTRFTLE